MPFLCHLPVPEAKMLGDTQSYMGWSLHCSSEPESSNCNMHTHTYIQTNTHAHTHAHARGKLDNSVHTTWHVTHLLRGVKAQSPAISAWPSPSCTHNSLVPSVLTYFRLPYSQDLLLGRSLRPNQSEQRWLLHFRTWVLPPPAFPDPISSSFYSFLRKWKS